MSQFVRHEPCPSCGSRDNLGVWDDGHKWCFGCGYGVPGYKGMSLNDIKSKLKQQEKEKVYGRACRLPSDFDYGIPAGPLEWLRKYGLTDGEIARNRIGWSDERFYLVLPVFDPYGNLLLWQGRYFGPNKSHPRYYTEGLPDSVVHVLGDDRGPEWDRGLVVVVEDLVSAIKVSRQFTTVTLFGSQISMDRIRKLSNLFTSLVIWLDRDKLKDAMRTQFKAKAFFNTVNVIVADKDPKEYNDNEIRRIIESSQANDRGLPDRLDRFLSPSKHPFPSR